MKKTRVADFIDNNEEAIFSTDNIPGYTCGGFRTNPVMLRVSYADHYTVYATIASMETRVVNFLSAAEAGP